METKLRIKRKSKKKTTWVIIFLLIFILIFFLGDIFRSSFFQHTGGLQVRLFESGKRAIQALFNTFSDKTLREENKKLKEENRQLLSQLLELKNLQQENKELREALHLKIGRDFQIIEAKIIARSTDNHTFVINKGKEDGITPGMAVITPQKIFVGKIKQVFKRDSYVELITSSSQKISVFIGKENLLGIVQGKGNFALVSENIPKEKKIEINDIVVTANLQQEIPSGLLVGKVVEVNKTDLSPFQVLKIEPLFDLSNINLLFIVTDF